MAVFSFLSTFPPTRCGIATFAESLAAAVTTESADRVRVVRVIDDLDVSAAASSRARIEIVSEWGADHGSIATAARGLDAADVAIVQHEYGIYPGQDGDAVLAVLAALEVPSIVVLHTVLAAPTDRQREILEDVARRATRIVVMTATARAQLASGYRVDMRKVTLIPHGVPNWDGVEARVDSDRRTMLTWGLIGRGKGIEWGIRAVAALSGSGSLAYDGPPVHYEVLGATHPKVLAHEGEAYRDELRALAASLGVADRVTFDDRYLERTQLAQRVASADVVLLPYDSLTQVTSGVLVEAVAAGKQVVATGFPHARELLAGGIGTLVPHQAPAEIARAVRHLLENPDAVAVRRRAVRSADAPWSAVAQRYRELADELGAPSVVQIA